MDPIEKGILRINNKGRQGYRARVYLKGHPHSKLFSDAKCGGPAKARDKAILWRNEKERELGKKRSNSRISGFKKTNTSVLSIKELRKNNTDKKGYSCKEKGISRFDRSDAHGYHAKVYLKGTMHSKLFSDSIWGGPEKTRDAAILWRNEKENEIGKIRSNKHVAGLQPTNTGVLGIKELRKEYTDKQGYFRKEHVLQITIQKHKTCVSIRRYGLKKAMEIALQKKKEIEARL